MKHFTIVELMIVVAIVMILAAIAIPNLNDMQLRAKRAEMPTNVDGLSTAVMAYEAANNAWLQGVYGPATLGKSTYTWPASTPLSPLGWAPDGKVRAAYSAGYADTVNNYGGRCPANWPAIAGACGTGADIVCVYGAADIDGNGAQSCYDWIYDPTTKTSNGGLLYTASTVY